MTQYIVKLLVSGAIIVGISELSKRSSFLGGLLASLPLVSLLGMTWLYLDTKDPVKVAALSYSIFWLVFPSLVLFLALPPLLKMKVNFFLAVSIATGLMLVAYGAMLVVLKKLDVKL